MGRDSLYLSYTGFSKLDHCPESWYREYQLRQRPREENQRNFVKGNAIHNLMEAYIILQEDNPEWLIDHAPEYWKKELARIEEDPKQFVQWKNSADEKDNYKKHLEWSINLADLFDKHNLNPARMKPEFKADSWVTLGGIQFKMAGRIDILMETKDGDKIFFDLKGSENKSVMNFDQIVWYSTLLGVYLQDPSQPVLGGYILPGFKSVKLYKVPPEAQRNLQRRIYRGLDRIIRQDFPNNPETRPCFFCPVKFACSAYGGAVEHKSGTVNLRGNL